MGAKYTAIAIVLLLCVQHNRPIWWGESTANRLADIKNLLDNTNTMISSFEFCEGQMKHDIRTIRDTMDEIKRSVSKIVDRQDLLHEQLLAKITKMLESQEDKPGKSLADGLKNLENEVEKVENEIGKINNEMHFFQGFKGQMEYDMKYFGDIADEMKLSLSKMWQRQNFISDQLTHIIKILESQYGKLPNDATFVTEV